jgi:hypothetical protein
MHNWELTSEATPSGASRFRILVNGFADDAAFPTLDEAIRAIPDSGVERSSFEIYDAVERAYVWTRPRRKASGAWPEPFSIRVNGRANGQSFATLTEAIRAISARPQGDDCEVFERGTRVFRAALRASPRTVGTLVDKNLADMVVVLDAPA